MTPGPVSLLHAGGSDAAHPSRRFTRRSGPSGAADLRRRRRGGEPEPGGDRQPGPSRPDAPGERPRALRGRRAPGDQPVRAGGVADPALDPARQLGVDGRRLARRQARVGAARARAAPRRPSAGRPVQPDAAAAPGGDGRPGRARAGDRPCAAFRRHRPLQRALRHAQGPRADANRRPGAPRDRRALGWRGHGVDGDRRPAARPGAPRGSRHLRDRAAEAAAARPAPRVAADLRPHGARSRDRRSRLLPRSLGELEGTYDGIARELRTLYGIGYVPRSPHSDGSWHRIDIQTREPNLVVRHRTGYYSPGPASRAVASR